MVTTPATFAYLGDVYVLPEARGCGLGRALVRAIVEHPDVAGIRRQPLPPPTPTRSTPASASGRSTSPTAGWSATRPPQA